MGFRVIALAMLAAFSVLLPGGVSAQSGVELLAGRIADSLTSIKDPRYQTVAFYRIRDTSTRIQTDQLIDFANVKIVQGRRLKVIDRSKLKLILKEQRIQLSEFVSAKKYQELGKLLGVDLFIYGTLYRDALVLKAISTQSSAIVWGDIFPLSRDPREAQLLSQLGGNVINSIRKDLSRIKRAKIRQVSFWNFSPMEVFSREAVMDYLSVALTKDGNLMVVDRENLKVITNEQKLNQSMFIDERSAKKLGQLHGVDAFIYGAITRGSNGEVVASMKMLNIFNGVIEWADIIRVETGNGKPASGDTAEVGKQSNVPDRQAPPGMVYVPPGQFMMGTPSGLPEATPSHRQNLQGFFIDQNEVSNSDYLVFVKKSQYRTPVGWKGSRPGQGDLDLPVVGVSWEDARRYCRSVDKRLPTEAEWELSARGFEGLLYPWKGNSYAPGVSVTRESGRKKPLPANSPTRDVSPFKVNNMGGNVREWVEDLFNPYPGGRGGTFKRGERVIRGGSWATSSVSAQTFYRKGSNPNHAWQDVGFRCARSG